MSADQMWNSVAAGMPWYNVSDTDANWGDEVDLLTSNVSMMNLSDDGNLTWNETVEWNTDDLIFTSLTSAILGILILTTIVGNVFVIAAILLERHLHSVANYLIVSLAVADLLVACLVMPLAAVNEISQKWILGPELCDMWTSSDVLCCTASILHLVAIAVDRYWAVTNIDYIHNRNVGRIGTMIFLVWAVALVVSVAPLLGWKDDQFIERVNEQQKCIISQDIAFQICATFATFYIPLTVILFLYWRIFQTARRRIRRRQVKISVSKEHQNWFKQHFSRRQTPPHTVQEASNQSEVNINGGEGTSAPESIIAVESPRNGVQTTAFTIDIQQNNGSSLALTSTPTKADVKTDVMDATAKPAVNPYSAKETRRKRETLEAKREKKAAKTLAIITGAFVVCWLPFFVCALLMPLYPEYVFDNVMLSIFLWLGYFNSTLNPIIYTIFSPEFRQAFKRLLCGKSAVQTSAYRPRKLR